MYRVKTRRVGHRGGPGGVNAPRRRGGQPDGQGGVHGDDEGDVRVHDEDDFVHLYDDAGDVMHIGETSTHIQGNEAEHHEVEARVGDPTQQSSYPNSGSLLPNNHLQMFSDSDILVSYHSPQLSPPHDQAEIDLIPPLSHPTVFRMTQSPPQPPKKPLQQPPDEQPVQQKQMKLRARKHEASTSGIGGLKRMKLRARKSNI